LSGGDRVSPGVYRCRPTRAPGTATRQNVVRNLPVGGPAGKGVMEFEPTAIPDVVLIKPRVFTDRRGFFFESYEARKLAAAGLKPSFVQDNFSHSVRFSLRGLHYQIEQPQGKLVQVARGEVFDVAVDIRRHSPYFGKWVGAILSETNHHMLWVPAG